MWICIVYFFVLHMFSLNVMALWDSEISCPMVCTCRLEHLKETAIYRFMKNHQDSQPFTETDRHINNEVLYEDDMDEEFLEDNPFIRAVTCILQTETEPSELIKELPADTESLTLIHGAGSGNKTITFSQFQNFVQLLILELHGTNIPNEKNVSHFFCEIDSSLNDVKYLNLDQVLIKASKKKFVKFENEVHEEVATFEYTQQLNPDLHPLTMIQRGTKKEVLPYQKYKEQETSDEIPLFLGFNNLILLRISNCELNNVNWEMFDGLHNLEYLILEKNNLLFIPDFAFYGTPNLKSLSLAWNNLLNIQITDLAGLLELEYLDLSHNNFSQLSELSFPPFPKLKLANFGNNPISVVFPSTFEVMNTTDSLILGGEETPLTLLPNSFLGLKMLKKLILQNLIVPLLKRELLVGMPNLKELIMSGNITKLEFDTFLDVINLEKLAITQANLQNISMDTFMGLECVNVLDLSQNSLEYLHPGTLDPLTTLKELYLNNNKFVQLPREIFAHIHPKLIRLNENPWHCSCKMSDWKPMIVNKIKQKSARNCDFIHDKNVGCIVDNTYDIKYVFDTRVAPKCSSPKKFINWNVFHVMRKQLKCSDYKPKIRKRVQSASVPDRSETQLPKPINLTANDTENHEQDSGDNIENNISVGMAINKTYTNDNQNLNDLYAEKMEKLRLKAQKHPGSEEIHSYAKLAATQDVPVKISLFPAEIPTNNEENNNLNFLHTNNYPPLNLMSPSNEQFQKTKVLKTKNHSQGRPRKVKKHRKNLSKTQITQTPM